VIARQKFQTRSIRLVGAMQKQTALAAIEHLPIDPDAPLEVVIREQQKVRGMDANARMWAGPLRDIAAQAWVNNRQFSAEVWHEHLKREYLPEDNDPELPELAKEGYRKWDIDPAGNRILVGSTTQLLKRGFALYLQQVEAFGAGLGVIFHEAPDRRAA
jgi:hypothetical protein